MDHAAVFERAEVRRQHGDLLPRGSDEEKWIATDPVTDCRGVGEFEQAARTNLVYAVEAYHEADRTVPYMSAGRPTAREMRWLREDDSSITDHLEDLLPF